MASKYLLQKRRGKKLFHNAESSNFWSTWPLTYFLLLSIWSSYSNRTVKTSRLWHSYNLKDLPQNSVAQLFKKKKKTLLIHVICLNMNMTHHLTKLKSKTTFMNIPLSPQYAPMLMDTPCLLLMFQHCRDCNGIWVLTLKAHQFPSAPALNNLLLLRKNDI